VRIVLTGATGFVAGELAPLLEDRGVDLLLVSRRWGAATEVRPGVTECGLHAVEGALQPDDVVIHLAGVPGDRGRTPEEVRTANVDLTRDLLSAAARAGVRRFVYVSSFHALDERVRTPYADSKREATRLVLDAAAPPTTVLALPAVHGGRWSGALSPLNVLPRGPARMLFGALKALKPTASAEVVADAVFDLAHADVGGGVELVADDLSYNPVYRGFRGAVDVAFVVTVAVALSWLIALAWVAVRATSRGSGFFVQERVGAGERRFPLVKLRTMALGTPERGTHEVTRASVTPVGALLRRSKLDELPQAWNVLRGQLSVVGPRPCLPGQTELVAARRARGIFDVRPGITGLAQVHGVDMSDPERLAEWDHRYLHTRSILLDLRILRATLMGRGFGDPVDREAPRT